MNDPRFRVFVTLLCVVSLTSCLVAQSQKKSAGPKLFIEKSDIDLGTIYSGEPKKVNFRIFNKGTDKLRIVSVQPSCGCTTAKLPKTELAPGEFDFVQLEFNSTGIQGDVTKFATILTNDPNAPSTTVQFRAKIISEFKFFRRGAISTSAMLGTYVVGALTSDTVALINISGKPIQVRQLTGSAKSINARIERKRIGPQDTVRIFITVGPTQSGYNREEFWLETSSLERPRIPIIMAYTAIEQKQP